MTTPLPLRLFLPLTPTNNNKNTIFTPNSFKSLSIFHSPPLNFNISSSPSHHRAFHAKRRRKWLCGSMRRDQDTDNQSSDDKSRVHMFGSDEEVGTQIPTQAQSVVEGSGSVMVSEFRPAADVDYLQELLAIQQQGPRSIGFFGTRNMGFMHQELIEILSYAMVITEMWLKEAILVVFPDTRDCSPSLANYFGGQKRHLVNKNSKSASQTSLAR